MHLKGMGEKMNSLNKVIFKNSHRRDNENKSIVNKALTVFIFFIIFGTISTIMGVASYYLTTELIKVNQAPAFINIVLLIMFIFLFSKSVFESLNNLYFAKDLKIFLRMPINPIKLVRAKINNMIVSEYVMELMMLLSPILVYGYLVKAGILFYIYVAIILLLLPIIPIVLTSLITSVIMRFTNVIKNKTQVQYISIFIVFIVLWIITSLFSTGEGISLERFIEKMLEVNGLIELISEYFIILKPIMNSLINYETMTGIVNIFIFTIESLVTYYLSTWIISKIYLKGAIGTVVNTNNMQTKKNSELKISECKQKTPKRAFLSKELKQIMRTPIFCLQCIILPMVYPILFIGIPAIALITFARNVGFDFFANMQENILGPIGISIAMSIAQVLYIMNFTSIIAISREGKKAKLMKTIPISLYKQFQYKLYPALIADGVIACIVTKCYSLFLPEINLLFSIFLFIILMELCLVQEKVMIMIDLKKPKITWTSEYAMMKENVNVMYEFFYAVIVVILLTGIGFVMNNMIMLMFVVFFILLLINLVINYYVKKNQIRLYRKIF